MGDLSPHFSRKELACKHCQLCSVSDVLIHALEELRNKGSEPIIIHDGYRCAEHNLAVGGVPHSQHPEGLAADLEIVGLSLQAMYERAESVPEFRDGGIGVYDAGFIHVDVRGHRNRWARKRGVYLPITALVVPVLWEPKRV